MSDVFSPYRGTDVGADARPAAIMWYRVFALAMALFYVAVAVFAWLNPPNSPAVIGVATLLALFYLVATFVPFEPWGWTVGLVALAIGLASCTIVVALPLAMAWKKPTLKAAFRRLP